MAMQSRNFTASHSLPMPNGTTAVDKIKKLNWKVSDEPGEFQWLRKTDLRVDLSYQRTNLSKQKILGIRANWSWLACGVILVCRREGELWVVDGQHRVQASMDRSDIEKLPCLIFESEGVIGEAQGFLKANTYRKPLTSFDRFNAMVVAGEKVAQDVSALLQLHGYEIAENSAADGHRKLKCIGAILGCAKEDFAVLEVVFGICVASAENKCIYERVIQGLFYIEKILNQRSDSIANAPWKARFVNVGQQRMKEAAERAVGFFGKGGAKIYAVGITELINKKCRNRLVLEDE